MLANGGIAVNMLAEGQDLAVSVKDNGLGILDVLRPHVFDLFAQSSRTIAASAGGLGVGLAVVKAVAELHWRNGVGDHVLPGTAANSTLRLPIGAEAVHGLRAGVTAGNAATHFSSC